MYICCKLLRVIEWLWRRAVATPKKPSWSDVAMQHTHPYHSEPLATFFSEPALTPKKGGWYVGVNQR